MSFQRRSSQPITWLILTNKRVQENTQTNNNSKGKRCKIQHNKTTPVESPLTVLSQKTRQAYSTMLLSPHRAQCWQSWNIEKSKLQVLKYFLCVYHLNSITSRTVILMEKTGRFWGFGHCRWTSMIGTIVVRYNTIRYDRRVSRGLKSWVQSA